MSEFTKYFLFGASAVKAHLEGTFIEDFEVEDITPNEYALYSFEDPCDPQEVLNAYTGWGNFIQISKIEFYAYCYLKSL